MVIQKATTRWPPPHFGPKPWLCQDRHQNVQHCCAPKAEPTADPKGPNCLDCDLSRPRRSLSFNVQNRLMGKTEKTESVLDSYNQNALRDKIVGNVGESLALNHINWELMKQGKGTPKTQPIFTSTKEPPTQKPPPWMNTRTGKLSGLMDCPFWDGRNKFRWRQSSEKSGAAKTCWGTQADGMTLAECSESV